MGLESGINGYAVAVTVEAVAIGVLVIDHGQIGTRGQGGVVAGVHVHGVALARRYRERADQQ